MITTNFAEFIRYFDSVRGRTTRVIDCVPTAHIEWRPRVGALSFGDLIRHIAATERFMCLTEAQVRANSVPLPATVAADA